MTFFYDEKQASSSIGETSWSTGNRTGYLENYRAARDAFFSSDRFDSEMNMLRSEYTNLTDILNKKGYTGFSNPVKDNEDVPLGPEDPRAVAIREAENIIEPSQEENVTTYWQRLEELKVSNPDIAEELLSLGYDSEENFKKTIGFKTQEKWEKYHDVSSRSSGAWYSGGGSTGAIAGSMAALISDPIVLASLPLGFAYGLPTAALASIGKVAVIEGAIGLGTEAIIQYGKVKKYRGELGLPTTINIKGREIDQALFNTLTVGVGSGLFAGLLQGAIKGGGAGIAKARATLNASSDAEINKIADVLKIEKPKDIQPLETPFEDNKATNIINENNHLEAQNVVLNDVKPKFIETETPINNKSLDEFNSNAEKYNPEEIEFDPVNFQYKTDVDASGVSQKLQGITEWDAPSAGTIAVYEFKPKTKFETNDVINIDANGTKATIIKTGLVISGKMVKDTDSLLKVRVKKVDGSEGNITIQKLKEFNKGKKAVVDGHQRLGLAKRLSAQGKKIELLGYTFREADGISPQEAMVKGLMMNLRNGTGTSIDAAKILRAGFNSDYKKFANSLAPRSNLVKNTDGLIKLSDEAWGMVTNNKVLENLASRVGKFIDDKSLHANILKVLSKKKFNNLGEMELVLRQANNLPKTVTKQDNLFGTEFFAETLLIERSQLLTWASKNLKRKSQAFRTIVENDKTLQKAGNKLNKLGNEEEKLLYEEILSRLEAVSLQHGELSNQLTRAAQLFKEGKRTDAEELFLQAIDDAAAKGDFRGIDVSGSSRINEAEIEAQTISKKFEEDLKTNKLFDEPVVGAKDQAPLLADELLGEGIPKSIKSEVDSGELVSTSPAVKVLSISQDLSVGSQRTNATPPSTVFAADIASPPSSLTDATKVIGDISSITDHKIYHIFNDINKIKELAKKNLPGYQEFLEKFKQKHNANLKVGIKTDKSIADKLKQPENLNKKPRQPESVGDILRARLDVDTIEQARAVAIDIKKSAKVIREKNSLTTEGREDGYRAIHHQILTKDGITVELQIRLKETAEILDRSGELRKMTSKDFKTAKGLAAFETAQVQIKAELDSAWLRAVKDQPLGSDELIDAKIVTGTKIINGEEVEDGFSIRQILEDDANELKAIERLKDCT
jgi:hypothetical protein